MQFGRKPLPADESRAIAEMRRCREKVSARKPTIAAFTEIPWHPENIPQAMWTYPCRDTPTVLPKVNAYAGASSDTTAHAIVCGYARQVPSSRGVNVIGVRPWSSSTPNGTLCIESARVEARRSRRQRLHGKKRAPRKGLTFGHVVMTLRAVKKISIQARPRA